MTTDTGLFEHFNNIVLIMICVTLLVIIIVILHYKGYTFSLNVPPHGAGDYFTAFHSFQKKCCL